MFAFFKRVLRSIASPPEADTSLTARPDEPKPVIDDRTLTPATWPGAEQKSSPFVWGGGCCG